MIRPKMIKLAAIRNVGAMMVVEILFRLVVNAIVTMKPRNYDQGILHKERCA